MDWVFNLFHGESRQRKALGLLIDHHIDGLFDRAAPEQAEQFICNMLCRTQIGAELCRDLPLGTAVVQISGIFKRNSNEAARVKVKAWARRRLGI